LPSRKHQGYYAMAVISALLVLAGCGGGSSSTPPPQQVTVSISNSSCASSTTNPCPIGVGANWQLAATVAGAANQSVTWSMSPSGASSGTIFSGTGLYIAPNSVPTPATVTITAMSVADSSASASVPVTIVANDPIGAVSSSSQLGSCAGSVPNGTCYQLKVSCPLIADFSAYLKVNTPTGAPTGTVLLGVGTGGSGLYDDPTAGGYIDGSNVVTSLVSSGYNTVQVSFGAPFDNGTQPNGWLTGPGGVRRLACRYATVADWVYHNPTIINPGNVNASNSAPMCATGNSGGSAVIAYAVYEYGLDSEFKMVEPTSGPVMTRIDQGCSSSCATVTAPICSNSSNVASMCYESADASVIDEAYQASGASTPTPCTDSLSGNPGPNAAAQFLSDSILYQPGQIVSLPNTVVKQLFGDSDTSNAVPEGLTWSVSVSPSPLSPNPIYQCLASPVAHDIPSFTTGATQIANDIAAACH
jgi:hypothetical protein